jgi:hypothetical protein
MKDKAKLRTTGSLKVHIKIFTKRLFRPNHELFLRKFEQFQGFLLLSRRRQFSSGSKPKKINVK